MHLYKIKILLTAFTFNTIFETSSSIEFLIDFFLFTAGHLKLNLIFFNPEWCMLDSNIYFLLEIKIGAEATCLGGAREFY